MSIIKLFRGCRSKAERENIFKNRTARGYTPANPDTTPPTKKEVSDYVAYGEVKVYLILICLNQMIEYRL